MQKSRLNCGAMVEAELRYLVDTGDTPVTQTTGPGGRLRVRTGGRDDPRRVAIEDARGRQTSIDVEGYTLVEAETAVEDFWSVDQVTGIYYSEVEALVRRVTGASRVVIFDHTLRSGDPARQEQAHAREPVEVVHNDYTDWSGPQRLRDVLPEEADALLQRRFAIVQVWRPMRGPVLAHPLALCDARSLAGEDLIKAERRHLDRVGEIYQVAYNPAHRWAYFPAMRRHEAIIFKVFDSDRSGRARFTAHTSFVDPTTPADAPPRESLELRTLALF